MNERLPAAESFADLEQAIRDMESVNKIARAKAQHFSGAAINAAENAPTNLTSSTTTPCQGKPMSAKQQIEDLVQAKIATGLKRDRAHAQVLAEHPALHRQMLIDANPGNKNAIGGIIRRFKK